MVPSFKYLSRLLSAADDDWPALIQKMTKARAVWRIMSRILSREGEKFWVSVFFFKAVFQLVLLFVKDMWLVTPPHGMDHWGFPIPDGEVTGGEAATAEVGRKLGVNLGGGGERGVGV